MATPAWLIVAILPRPGHEQLGSSDYFSTRVVCVAGGASESSANRSTTYVCTDAIVHPPLHIWQGLRDLPLLRSRQRQPPRAERRPPLR